MCSFVCCWKRSQPRVRGDEGGGGGKGENDEDESRSFSREKTKGGGVAGEGRGALTTTTPTTTAASTEGRRRSFWTNITTVYKVGPLGVSKSKPRIFHPRPYHQIRASGWVILTVPQRRSERRRRRRRSRRKHAVHIIDIKNHPAWEEPLWLVIAPWSELSAMLLGPRGGTDHVPSGRVKMDTSKAMALLGFSSSKTFEGTDMGEIQTAFMLKLHNLEMKPVDRRDPRATADKRDELRKVNEAFQYLTKKHKRFSGRSMTQNWQAAGGKSKAVHNIFSLKSQTLDQPLKTPNPLETVLMKNEHLLRAASAVGCLAARNRHGNTTSASGSSASASSASSNGESRAPTAASSTTGGNQDYLKPRDQPTGFTPHGQKRRPYRGRSGSRRSLSPSLAPRLATTSVRRPAPTSPRFPARRKSALTSSQLLMGSSLNDTSDEDFSFSSSLRNAISNVDLSRRSPETSWPLFPSLPLL